MITVLGISGSQRRPSRTHTLLEIALSAARDSGARVELLDLLTLPLPMYEPSQDSFAPHIKELSERIADAHAYIIGTPVYYGGMSGLLKNLFDHLIEEISGKVAGLLVTTGSGQGSTTFLQLRDILSYFHTWALPYGVESGTDDFDEAGNLTAPRVRDRLLRLGRDVTVYGELLHEQYMRDRIPGGGTHLGFAPWLPAASHNAHTPCPDNS